jgi:tRNA A37 threonylcarbamoyladenosine biosynthesis protein TsaE
MDIKTFTAVAKVLPPNISVCIRGAHGIGKSSLTYQIAEAMGLNTRAC